MVSCFLIDVNDSMLSIGRAVNSALQLSRIGGGVGATSLTSARLVNRSKTSRTLLLAWYRS